MSRVRLFVIIMILLIPLSILGLWALTDYFNNLPERLSQHETLVFGQSRLTPGSQAALRVVVRDSRDGTPLPQAEIRVKLRPQNGGRELVVFTGKTDLNGGAEVVFQTPDAVDPSQTLVIETKSSLGEDALERSVTIERDYRLLLSTDKPIYQPGQIIHLRLLALSAFDLYPAAGQTIEVVIADGKGNKVFRKKVLTNEYGVAATDFQLASEVNTGAYKISASMGNTSSEKTITVETYVLPKFNVKIEPERSFYLPGQTVSGVLRANYFFGKPVNDAQVKLTGYTFDVEMVRVFELQGATDEAGNYEFRFDLPAYIAGSDLEGGLGRFYLQATLTDQAAHSETANLALPVSGNALIIEAIPESGLFRKGVENILYILTSYPDGAPAETQLTVFLNNTGESYSIESGPYGLAEVRFTPNDAYVQFRVEARDRQGNQAQQEFYFEGEYSNESILLRPEKPVYRVGEAMKLVILASQVQGTAYLDIVREGQTVSTRSVELKNGQAEVVVDLTPDLFGTVELHAYKILADGTIIRDTRLVVIDQAEGLKIQIGAEEYRPGDPASLQLQVSGDDGQGVRSAVGLAIVDEAVFALAEQDPGFAKLYFLLEKELLEPKYDLHGFSVPELVRGTPLENPEMVNAVEDAAQASLAAGSAAKYGAYAKVFSLEANSRQQALARTAELQRNFFSQMVEGLFVTMLIIPLAVLGFNGYWLWREKRLGSSLLLTALLVLVLGLVVLFWPLGDNYAWVNTPAERLEVFFEWLSYGNAGLFLGVILLMAPVSFLGLVAFAWRKGDIALGVSLILAILLLIVSGFLVYAVVNSGLEPDDRAILAGLLACTLIPVAFLLRSAGFAWDKRWLAALAGLSAAIGLLAAPLAVAALAGSMSASPRQFQKMGGASGSGRRPHGRDSNGRASYDERCDGSAG